MVADIVILAIYAGQVAAGEENSTGAAEADKNGFFAEVRTRGTDLWQLSYPAKARLSFAAADFAVAGTKCAGIHPAP